MQSTSVVKNNGFNPVWRETMSLPFDCMGGMHDLVFVKFQVKDQNDETNLAVYCVPLGCLQLGTFFDPCSGMLMHVIAGLLCTTGYRHLPLHDAQLSQYLFSTLFVKTDIRTVG